MVTTPVEYQIGLDAKAFFLRFSCLSKISVLIMIGPYKSWI